MLGDWPSSDEDRGSDWGESHQAHWIESSRAAGAALARDRREAQLFCVFAILRIRSVVAQLLGWGLSICSCPGQSVAARYAVGAVEVCAVCVRVAVHDGLCICREYGGNEKQSEDMLKHLKNYIIKDLNIKLF